MSRSLNATSSTGERAGLGAAALMLICCAAPVLLAGGLAAQLGARLRNRWLIDFGWPVLPAAIVSTARRIAGPRTPAVERRPR
jgi:mercuric ion transport protein